MIHMHRRPQLSENKNKRIKVKMISFVRVMSLCPTTNYATHTITRSATIRGSIRPVVLNVDAASLPVVFVAPGAAVTAVGEPPGVTPETLYIRLVISYEKYGLYLPSKGISKKDKCNERMICNGQFHNCQS